MSEYTEQELKALSRVDLRREAVKALGITNAEATNYKSDQLIDMILGKDNGKGKGKPAPAAAKGKGKPEPSQDDGEGEQPKGKAAAPAGLGEVVKHLQAIGKGMDENHESLQAQLDEIERKVYIVSGLMTDVYKAVLEPDELEGRLTELDKEWKEQAEADGGNE